MYLERWVAGGDKIEHVIASAAIFLIIFWIVSFFEFNIDLYITSFLLTLLIGALEEIRQVKIKKRECDMKDWLADFIGACLGLLAVLILF